MATNAPEYVFNPALEPETLTDKEKTKSVPCRKCGRECVVTLFATAEKTECNTCRGVTRGEKREQVVRKAAETLGDPARLDNLSDALINSHFKVIPLCPFDPEHTVELKSVTHSDSYGPRRMLGYDAKNNPKYKQEVGESVMYQCNDCRTLISFSTQHPMLLKAQNEARRLSTSAPWAIINGVRD